MHLLVPGENGANKILLVAWKHGFIDPIEDDTDLIIPVNYRASEHRVWSSFRMRPESEFFTGRVR